MKTNIIHINEEIYCDKKIKKFSKEVMLVKKNFTFEKLLESFYDSESLKDNMFETDLCWEGVCQFSKGRKYLTPHCKLYEKKASTIQTALSKFSSK